MARKPAETSEALKDLRARLLQLLLERGYERRPDPFQLSSGAWSRDYIDAKRAMSLGTDLRLVAETILGLADELDVTFDAVGGLTLGADAPAHAVSLLSGCSWFTVRKEQKAHGKQRLIEGADIEGKRVVLVDDVVTTGKSILQAWAAVVDAGAEVSLAVCLVDRGDEARERLRDAGVRYESLLTYKDLEIEPVASGRVSA